MLAVLRTMKSIISKDSESLSLFSVCRSCMALMPMGVAALPRPKKFASRFRLMDVIAGWSPGMSLKSRLIRGRNAWAIWWISPESSMTLAMPSHRETIPRRKIDISTAALAPSNMALVTASGPPEKNAATMLTAIRTTQTKFILRDSIRWYFYYYQTYMRLLAKGWDTGCGMPFPPRDRAAAGRAAYPDPPRRYPASRPPPARR